MTELEEAKKYLSQQGYGSGTNYTTDLVALLLKDYAKMKFEKSYKTSNDVYASSQQMEDYEFSLKRQWKEEQNKSDGDDHGSIIKHFQ